MRQGVCGERRLSEIGLRVSDEGFTVRRSWGRAMWAQEIASAKVLGRHQPGEVEKTERDQNSGEWSARALADEHVRGREKRN